MALYKSADWKSGNAGCPTGYVAIQTSCSSSFPHITRDSLTCTALEAPAEVLSSHSLELQKYTDEQESYNNNSSELKAFQHKQT